MLGKITFILLILLLSISLQAQTVMYNQEFQINTNSTGGQFQPAACGLSNSGFVICWHEWPNIYAQIFNSDGTKYGEEFQVNTTVNAVQELPSISALSDGGFVVCWESWMEDWNESNIFAQIFNSDGSKNGEEFEVDINTSVQQRKPCVAGLKNNEFIVCWSVENPDTYDYKIFGQLYDGIGGKKGEAFQVNTNSTEDPEHSAVCGLSNGGFAISWVDWPNIAAQIYNSNGTQSGESFIVNSNTIGNQWNPCIVSLLKGGFIVCWENWTDSNVFAQIFDNDGIKQGSEIQIDSNSEELSPEPSACSLSYGGFLIFWQSWKKDGDNSGIFGQLFDSSGAKQDIAFQVNTYTTDNQEEPSAISLSDGKFVVCWSSWGQDGSAYGVFGKYYLGVPIVHSLQSFSLLSPVFDTVLYSTTIDFQWQQASPIHLNFPWELEYSLYLDQTDTFNDPQIFSDIHDTTFSLAELTSGQTYFWKVLAKNIDGDSLWSSETFGFYVSPAADIEDDLILKPETFKLYPNYPNPFNPETIIRYSVPADQSSYRVIVKIYDVLGQLVITLRDEQQRPGLYQLTWDGQNAAGQAVPSGVYFLTLEAGNFKATQKMLLVR